MCLIALGIGSTYTTGVKVVTYDNKSGKAIN